MGRKRELVRFKLPQGASLPLSVPLPTPAAGRFWRVVRFHPGDKHNYLILSDAAVSIWTHFQHGQTVPCLREVVGDCPMCGKLSRRWQAYLACWDEMKKETVICPLTQAAADGSPALRRNVDLAGRRLEVIRRGHKRSRLNAAVSGHTAYELPKERIVSRSELLAQLLAIFGVAFDYDQSEAPCSEESEDDSA